MAFVDSIIGESSLSAKQLETEFEVEDIHATLIPIWNPIPRIVVWWPTEVIASTELWLDATSVRLPALALSIYTQDLPMAGFTLVLLVLDMSH